MRKANGVESEKKRKEQRRQSSGQGENGYTLRSWNEGFKENIHDK